MKTSELTDKLATAFAAAQAELKNAAFDKVNPHFKAKYATLAGVRDTVTPILSKHLLSITQGTEFLDGGHFVLTTRLMHSSGQWIESVYPFAIDKPQVMGSAMTYARRYSLAAICGIASEEDDDGNEGQNGSKPAPMQKPAAKPAPTIDYNKISAGIKAIQDTGTDEDLTAWYRGHVKTIEAFPPDLVTDIMNEFSAARKAIKAKAEFP
jgi:hypothetical protein